VRLSSRAARTRGGRGTQPSLESMRTVCHPAAHGSGTRGIMTSQSAGAPGGIRMKLSVNCCYNFTRFKLLL
jgi:hypothetical protein